MTIDTPAYIEFHRLLTDFYYQQGRHDMPWRTPEPDGGFSPYKILVSELMLQQTQVARVEPKFLAFIERFPNIKQLAAAELAEVLGLWNGLGYNRRAKYLHETAKAVHARHKDSFPRTFDELTQLPGIGPNTAGAILAYGYNEPAVFIETNIRTVIIHHFFKDGSKIPDRDIKIVLEQLLPGAGADSGAVLDNRQFYWAMMDYGTYLKKTVGNRNAASKAYKKQTAFHGSVRQLRGKVLRMLTDGPLELSAIYKQLEDERAETVVAALQAEGLIRLKQGKVYLG